MTGDDDLARLWRSARLPATGVHLDSAACSRQSLAALEAADQHARRESVEGGYVAAQSATATLGGGRAAVAALTGMPARDVAFTTGSGAALDTVLRMWSAPRTVACLPGEYGPNLAAFAAHGFTRATLPTDHLGRLDPDAAAAMLRAAPPAMVHLTALGSHRGIAQPVAEAAAVCRRIGVPLVVDAAQALGHLDCAAGADVVYASSRKWLAGPRGVGVLAIRAEVASLLAVPDGAAGLPLWGWLETGEANVAARVGFSVAAQEHVAIGPERIRRRLAALGAAARAALAGVRGWRVVEPVDEPTAIVTLESTAGADPVGVRSRLLAEHGILTTAIPVARAPGEMTAPALRISPHVDSTAAEFDRLGAALHSGTP